MGSTFEMFKTDPQVSWYPQEKFKIRPDMTSWCTCGMVTGITEEIKKLPANSVVLELGTFLGSGSTTIILEARDDVNMVCVDDFGIQPFHIPIPIRPEGWRSSAYFSKEGTAWQHFVNNTWEHRQRVVPVGKRITSYTLNWLGTYGLPVGCVFIDADHNESAVYEQLCVCRYLWPEAVLLLDDYNDNWPGVRIAVDRAIAEDKIKKGDLGEIYDNRVLVIR